MAETPMPAAFLERYELLECLGENGGTQTYLARRRSDGAKAVAKCGEPGAGAALLGALRHPGLPAFFESFSENGAAVPVRAYAEGEPLDRYAADRRLSDREILRIGSELCRILRYLHGRTPPVIHRDIKPQNVIIGPDGQVVLIDFGCAREYRQGAGTDTEFFGTRAYAPPEQYGFSQTDARTDLYALGVLLRFLLTGTAQPDRDRALPPPLRRLIARCTAFSPKERYRSAAQVQRALDAALRRDRLRGRLRPACALLAAALLAAGFCVGRYTAFPSFDAGVRFREPLIEQAVRAQLALDGEEPITKEMLQGVEELYIFGTEVSKTQDTFRNGLGGEDRDRYSRGTVASLEDLSMLPNLVSVEIAYQSLERLDGVETLENLRTANFMHTRVSDASPLAGLEKLESVTLYDTDVADTTALSACPRLTELELGATPTASAAAIGGRDTLRVLSLKQTRLDTLDGLGQFAALETVTLTGASLGDVSPLAALPKLQSVRADAGLYDRLTALFAGTEVTVTLEE